MENFTILLGGLYLLMVLMGILNFLQSLRIQRILEETSDVRQKIISSAAEMGKKLDQRFNKIKNLLEV